MGKILPFIVPPNKAKMENIRFAEELLTNENAIKKASFATDEATLEFGIFPTGAEILEACLTRNTDGKIVDGFVRQFTEPNGLKWFQDMKQRIYNGS